MCPLCRDLPRQETGSHFVLQTPDYWQNDTQLYFVRFSVFVEFKEIFQQFNIRPKKFNCLFPVTARKKIGKVGRKKDFFCMIFLVKNVSNSSSVHISFLIGGLNSEYSFQKLRIHKLMSS